MSTGPLSPNQLLPKRVSPLRTRSHAITFRLGAGEYEELLNVVERVGARSISEFARTAVLNSIIAGILDRSINNDLESLVVSLEAFDARIRELRRHIRQLDMAARSAGV